MPLYKDYISASGLTGTEHFSGSVSAAIRDLRGIFRSLTNRRADRLRPTGKESHYLSMFTVTG